MPYRVVRSSIVLFTICLLANLFPPPVTLARPAGAQPARPAMTRPAVTPALGRAASAQSLRSDNISAPVAAPVALAQALNIGRRPLAFEPNVGQSNNAVRFLARGQGSSLFFTSDAIVIAVETQASASPDAKRADPRDLHRRSPARPASSVVRLRFDGANPAPEIEGVDRLPGVVNYARGDDPAQWHFGIPTYTGIIYRQLYPGIDLRYDGQDGLIKGTYLVAPDADASRIRWQYTGATDTRVDPAGNLVISLPAPPATSTGVITPATLIEQAPRVWQEVDGRQTPVSAQYVVAADGSVSFALGAYDQKRPLLIDPTLVFGGYLGGAIYDEGTDIAVDAAGNLYITGTTYVYEYEGYVGADGFVVKLSPDGQQVYQAAVGGTDGNDISNGIAVDSAGNAYVTGWTDAEGFATPGNPYDASLQGQDVFVAKLGPLGAQVYGTYIGGSMWQEGYDIAVSRENMVYITGYTASTDFPTARAWRSAPSSDQYRNGFVAQLDLAAGTDGLVYGSYLTEDGSFAEGIAVDGTGDAYISGTTYSATDFGGPIQSEYGGQGDAFVIKLDLSEGGSGAPEYRTYLGGESWDRDTSIAVDRDGNAYVTGYTNSPELAKNARYPSLNGVNDAFVAKINPAGTALEYRTYLGGSGSDAGTDIAVDSAGNVYITGHTNSPTFPGAATPQNSFAGGYTDAFVALIPADPNMPVVSTYLGGSGMEGGTGIAADDAGNAYVTGSTSSADFLGQSGRQGPSDAFVAKLNFGGPIQVRITDAQGRVVSALKTNDDGWPALNANGGAAANPLKVTVTVQNDEIDALSGQLIVSMDSADNKARFYIWDAPDACSTGFGFHEQLTYSYYSAAASCVVPPGVDSWTFTWQVWVQPSSAATLDITANLQTQSSSGSPQTSIATNHVQVPEAHIHPVVFIHGVLGSMSPQNKLLTSERAMWDTLDPFLGIYWPLMDQLQKMGYEWDKTLFAQAYDWRQSNDVSADVLARSLDTVAQNAGSLSYVARDDNKVKADLIVHSMGGLVSRAYIQRAAGSGDGKYHQDVRKVIFMASPHKGFPFDYQMWEGMTWSRFLENAPVLSGNATISIADFQIGVNALSILMDYNIWPRLVGKRYNPDLTELTRDCTEIIGAWPGYAVIAIDDGGTAREFNCGSDVYTRWAHDSRPDKGVQSLYEMLPAQDIATATPYLINNDGNPSAPAGPYPYGHEFNEFLHQLNAPDNVQQLVTNLGDPQKADNIYVLYGDGEDTDTAYEVGPQGSVMWRRGAVDPYGYGRVRQPNGDDLISKDSTKLSPVLPSLLVDNPNSEQGLLATDGARHKEIMYYSRTQQEWIPRFLGAISDQDKLPFQTDYAPPNAITNLYTGGLTFVTGCPINLLITDPQGRRLGYEPATGQVLREIPNAVYTPPGVEPQIVLISNPISGSYQVSVTGYDTGVYDFQVDRLDGNRISPIALFSGRTTNGQVDSYTMTYDPASPQVQPPPAQRALEGTPATVALGAFDAPAAGRPWTVEIDWGDGSGPTSFTTAVSGTLGTQPHAYADDARYTVAVTVTGADGRTGSTIFPVVVENTAPTVVTITAPHDPVTVNTPVSASANFTDLGTQDSHTARWDWGDGSTSGGAIGEANGSGTVSGGHSYTSAGSYTVTLTVTDNSGGAGQAVFQSITVQVTNSAPHVGTISTPDDPVKVRTVIRASASFTDADILDTHRAVWDWGDGSTSEGAIGEANGSGTVRGSHTYTSAGVYMVRLIVTDPAGGAEQASSRAVVVYDPAGFVAGGGWITSPPGAYPANAQMTGKATFGVVAGYQRGARVPSGATAFSFPAARLTFHSTSYEWLAVAGTQAQLKGTGTLNGRRGYDFLLTVASGSGKSGRDAFRIKIWEQATGRVVYDTQPGAADAATPTLRLGSGMIVIHKNGGH